MVRSGLGFANIHGMKATIKKFLMGLNILAFVLSCGGEIQEENKTDEASSSLSTIETLSNGMISETFKQAYYYSNSQSRKMDVIVVLDDSQSMSNKLANLKLRLIELFSKFPNNDLCIAVLKSSVDLSNLGAVDFHKGSMGQQFACSQNANMMSILNDNLSITFKPEESNGNNASFLSLSEILKKKSIYQSKGFFRSDAKLALIFVSDEAEVSERKSYDSKSTITTTVSGYYGSVPCTINKTFRDTNYYYQAEGLSSLKKTMSVLDMGHYQTVKSTQITQSEPSRSVLFGDSPIVDTSKPCTMYETYTRVINVNLTVKKKHAQYSSEISRFYNAVIGNLSSVSLANEDKAYGYIDFVNTQSNKDLVGLNTLSSSSTFLNSFSNLISKASHVTGKQTKYTLTYDACPSSIQMKIADQSIDAANFVYDAVSKSVFLIDASLAGLENDNVVITYEPKKISQSC